MTNPLLRLKIYLGPTYSNTERVLHGSLVWCQWFGVNMDFSDED